VDKFASKFGILTVLRDKPAMRRYPVFRALFLLLFLGLVGGSAAASADVGNAPVASFGPNPQFAIDDFDGDLRPDVASIQPGQSGFSSTDYWIQLQLSAAGRQSIRVVGPVGGLIIEARDVNGDRAVDLVLVTAWRRQPVAILLNDGHGSFSRVEPTAFPDAFRESTKDWASALDQTIDAFGVPPQSRASIFPKARTLPSVQARADSMPRLTAGFLFNPFLVSHAGRAPPV
jgi:hypothetical protein